MRPSMDNDDDAYSTFTMRPLCRVSLNVTHSKDGCSVLFITVAQKC